MWSHSLSTRSSLNQAWTPPTYIASQIYSGCSLIQYFQALGFRASVQQTQTTHSSLADIQGSVKLILDPPNRNDQSHHLFQSLVSLHSFNSKSTFSLNSFSRPGKFSIRGDQVNYSGCMKEVVIEGKPVEMTADRLIGDIHSHVCPTI